MNIKHLVLSTITAISLFSSAQAGYVLTKKSSIILREGLKSCGSQFTAPNDIIEYYNCFSTEILFLGKTTRPVCSKNIKASLKDLGCNDGFIKYFTSAYNADNLEAHKNKLKEIKSDFEDFKSKNLTGSAQVNKYLDYIENNGLEGMVVADPQMIKEMRDNKAKYMARKNSCSDVMNLKGALSVDEPRNQDTVGWCYAFTSSDLLSHALGKKVSAVQLSGLFNDKLIAKVFSPNGEGGFVLTTLEQARKNGICLESDLPSEDYEFSQMFGPDLKELFNYTRKLGTLYSKRIITSRNVKNNNETSKPMFTKDEVKSSLCMEHQGALVALQEIFPKLSLDQISEIFLKSGIDAFTKMTKSCGTQRDNDLASLEFKREWQSSKIYPTIDEQLSKGNILGISYHSGMLANSGEGGFMMNHASSIVGRRFNEETMSCEYLLRNSWGSDCGSYSEDYDCNNGHVWIGEEYFKHKNSIFEVEYVEKK